MRSAVVVAVISLLLVSPLLCYSQSCTNWNYFQPPPPYTATFGTGGIDAHGTIVGNASQNLCCDIDAFVRLASGGFRIYAAPNAYQTLFNRRNISGTTVGFYTDNASISHGVKASGSGVVTIDYPDGSATVLTGINDWNTIVGDASVAFTLKNGVFTALQYPGANSTYVNSINNNGIIVGYYMDGNFVRHGFTLQNGVYTSVDDPNANDENGTNVTDVNSSGEMVGVYYRDSLAYSFLYKNGTFQDIAPPDTNYTIVTGINDKGQIVGTTNFNSGGYTMFTGVCQ